MHRYTIGRTLGEGAFGQVKQALHTESGEKVAIKTLKERSKDVNAMMALPEVKALRSILHENIVQCKELILDRTGHVHIIFELLPGGNLESLTRRRTTPYTEHQVRSVFYQLLLAIKHMHSINYMHRDIKPENILLQSSSIDEEIKIKLADLGLAKRYDPSSSRPHTTYVATRWYRSPEILLRITDYSFPSDLWAIGAVMAEFVSLGEPLFPGDDEKDQLARVVALRGHPSVVSWKKGTAVMQSRRIKLPKVTSSSLKNAIPLASLPVLQLISDLLEMDPACRPSASEALEYPLFLSQMTDTRESTHIRKRQKLDSREWDTAVSRDFPSSRLSCGSDDIQGALNFQSDVHNQMQVPPGRPQKPCHSELYGNKTTEESSMCFNIPQRNSEEKERSYGLDQGNMGHRQPAGQFNMRVTD